MKVIASLVVLVALSGCSLLPVDHDPALVSKYVDLQMSMDSVNCENKETFKEPIQLADWLNRYALFREDPQQIATKALLTNLTQASAATVPVCQRWVSLANINMKSIRTAWSGR